MTMVGGHKSQWKKTNSLFRIAMFSRTFFPVFEREHDVCKDVREGERGWSREALVS
jgi:hypothetical protein